MHLQIWHEPMCNAKIRLSVKRKASLGTLVTRYRSIIASWPTFFLLGIMCNILVPASRTNGQVSQQASFEASLRRFLLNDMKVWLGVTAAMGVAQVALDRFNLFPHQLPDILVGTRHMAFLWLAPALLALTASLIIVSHWLMNGMVYILGAVYALSSWTYRLESQ